jgi:4'-phosphopantetheinyl transferase
MAYVAWVTARAGEPFFAGDGAEVWLVELPPVANFEDVLLLGPEERDRLGHFIDERAAARFATAHAAARRILATRLGCSPAEVVLGRQRCPACGSAEHGPPAVVTPGPSVSFSLSRSGGFGLVAVAGAAWLGVDLEELRLFQAGDVVARCLSSGERAYLAGLGPDDALTAFYRCWVRKEAVLKAVGLGVAADLASVPVHPELAGPLEVSVNQLDVEFGTHSGPDHLPNDPPDRLPDHLPDHLLVHDLDPRPGYVGALALSDWVAGVQWGSMEISSLPVREAGLQIESGCSGAREEHH